MPFNVNFSRTRPINVLIWNRFHSWKPPCFKKRRSVKKLSFVNIFEMMNSFEVNALVKDKGFMNSFEVNMLVKDECFERRRPFCGKKIILLWHKDYMSKGLTFIYKYTTKFVLKLICSPSQKSSAFRCWQQTASLNTSHGFWILK